MNEKKTLSENKIRHTKIDDIYGIILGVMFFSLGLYILHSSSLITGGVAGVALLLSWFVKIPIGYLFIIVNIPFVIFSFWSMGFNFTIKTCIVNASLIITSVQTPKLIAFSNINPLLSAVVGGTMIGVGLLFLARHNASAGGTIVMTLWAQKKYGINAGKTQMVLDSILFLISIINIPFDLFIYSLLSGLSMNAMLIAWHKPGRYFG